MMGTSSSSGGPGGGTPLVPSWLDDPSTSGTPGSGPGIGSPDGTPPAPPDGNPNPSAPVPAGDRFRAARANFSRYAGSGGRDTRSLGRALSRYITTSAGGSGTAMRRMGSSRSASGRLFGFLANVQERGAAEALRDLDLSALAGRPIQDVFLGMVDFICPEGGTIDEGIARDAFCETIVDLASLGIADLDALTVDQMDTVLETFMAHSVEGRIYNDIGMKSITLPVDVPSAENVQAQFCDFVRRAIHDAVTATRTTVANLTRGVIQKTVDRVYEVAFDFLRIIGDELAS